MIVLSPGATQAVSAPPLAPLDRPIDFEHLSRMTLGESALEREVLQLFERQAGMMIARMRDALPAVIAASAHTLKGSALGIGAWDVARAAEAVELAAANDRGALADRIETLRIRVAEASTVIADLQRSH